MMSEKKILIACEESQVICTAFRDRGFEAYSCDLQYPSGNHPEWHIQCNALDLLDNDPESLFYTIDCKLHKGTNWDLIIAHPPCTYLTNAAACRLYPRKGILDQSRFLKGLQAKDFFMSFYNADYRYICIENPLPSKCFDLPPYTQIIQPYQYGHPFSKKTLLWLKGLPELQPTKIILDYKPYVSSCTSRFKGIKEKMGFSRAGGAAKIRSRTFFGIAQAMAYQWGDFLNE